MSLQLGQFPPPRRTVAHLSDTHVLADALLHGSVDTEAGVAAALTRLCRLDPSPDAIVVTGDLADRGEPEVYAGLRDLLEPLAADLGAALVWVMGNHDAREPFARELHGVTGEAALAPQDRVHHVGGLRVVALDTSVPGWHHGELRPEQLDWLAGVLAEPAPEGTLLAMHHPPIPAPTMPVAELIELHDVPALEAVVRGSDVRGVLAGHYHYASFSTFAGGVPVCVASATCYTTDPAPDRRLVSGVDGAQAFSVVHLYDDRLVSTVVPLAEAPEVTGHDIAALELLRSVGREVAFEQVSRHDSDLNTGALRLPGPTDGAASGG